MNFRCSFKRAPAGAADETTFTIDRLWRSQEGREAEVSHMVDRSYRYRSRRELRWHLADRFALPVERIDLQGI